VLRALQKLPADRFSSAGDFARALSSSDPAAVVPQVTEALRALPRGSARASRGLERTLTATGARPLGPRVQVFTFGAASFAASQRGQLVYLQAVSASPSGRQLAIEARVARLPPGGQIVVMQLDDSLLNGARDIVWQPADGSGAAQPMFIRPGSQWEVTFTPDQRWIVYREGGASRNEEVTVPYRPVRGGTALGGGRSRARLLVLRPRLLRVLLLRLRVLHRLRRRRNLSGQPRVDLLQLHRENDATGHGCGSVREGFLCNSTPCSGHGNSPASGTMAFGSIDPASARPQNQVVCQPP
jgi:hypothetical protein